MPLLPRYWGDKRTSILPYLTPLALLGIPVHPASPIRLAGATFLILGVVLIRSSRRR
jgi:hypothetical protein